jgi:hypothetical protein
MKSFTKPQNLNGAVLVDELEAAGIKVKANAINVKCPSLDGAALLWLDIEAKDESAAKVIVLSHAG